jgi:CRISPR type I-E-associated protein CasB/Cse2
MSRERTDWREAVGKIAGEMARGDHPAASLATLRRLDPEQPDGAAFWLLIAKHAPAAFDDDRAARALAMVVQGMAIAHPFHLPIGVRRRPGMAMAEAGVSEARLLRLLRTGGAQLPDELRRLARLMASKGEDGRFDWSDMFDLVFCPESEHTRSQIAKDYYRASYRLDQEKRAEA